MSVNRQFTTFLLDGMYFGVDVLDVQEVIRFQEMTPVPLSSPMVSGLINLRGQIVTAIDLRRSLGLPDRPEGQVPMNVVVRLDDEVVSYIVDSIGEVIAVDQADFEPPPDTLPDEVRGVVCGLYKLENALLLILDPPLISEQTPPTRLN